MVTNLRTFMWTTLLTLLVLIFVVIRLQPPEPKSTQESFSARQVEAILQDIFVDEIPRPVDSEESERTREQIINYLASLEYEIDIQESFICREGNTVVGCATPRNILARLPGQQAGKSIVLVAHYDSIPAGSGVADNGVNVATVLEIATILKSEGVSRNPIIFLFSDAEENGSLGAQLFVNEHPWAKDIGVVINLEARGTGGQSLMFETSSNNAWLINAYASSVDVPAANSLFFEIYRTLPNSTDFTIFKEKNIPGVNFAFIQGLSRYHTPLDNMENLDWGSVQHQGENTLKLVQYLAGVDLSNPPSGNASYIDVLSYFVLYWPETNTVVFAFLNSLLILIAATLLIRQQSLTKVQIFWGLATPLLSLLTAVIFGLGLTEFVSTIAGVSTPWYAHPFPTRLALWLAGILSGLLISARFVNKATFWGLAIGVWLFWSILALIFAFTLTGAAIVFLLPGLFASSTLLTIILTRTYHSGPIREIAFIMTISVTCVIWFPLVILLESAVGLEIGPAITVPLFLITTTTTPFLAVPPREQHITQRLLPASLFILIVGAAVITIFLPSYSTDRPQQLNLIHFDDRDLNQAYWVADHASYIPDELYTIGNFEPESEAIFPWTSKRSFVIPADPTTRQPPEINVVAEQMIQDERIVELRISSPQGTARIGLFVPIETLKTAVINGKEVTINHESSFTNLYYILCNGRSCNNLSVTLHFENKSPVTVLLVDWTFGLPASGKYLQEARSKLAVPFQDGDTTIILRRLTMP